MSGSKQLILYRHSGVDDRIKVPKQSLILKLADTKHMLQLNEMIIAFLIISLKSIAKIYSILQI